MPPFPVSTLAVTEWIDFFKLRLEALRPPAVPRTVAGARLLLLLAVGTVPSLTIGFSSGMSFSVKTWAAVVAAATSDCGCTTAAGVESAAGGLPVESADD